MDLLDDEGLLDLRRRRSRDVEGAVRELRGERAPVPDQNEALRSWRDDGAPEATGAQGDAGQEHGGADATAACHVCGRAARMRCQACGRGACASDSWLMLGVCRACATEERVKAWREGHRPERWL